MGQPGGPDFRLRAGSPAINTGIPSDAPATDRDGLLRDSRPDAGAYEFGARAPGDGHGSSGSAAGLRLLGARLKPKLICVRARKHCPHTTRLRVVVSLGRARHGPREAAPQRPPPEADPPFGFQVRTSGVRKISAKKLHKGRYRVVVRATKGGAVTQARSLALRVR